MPNNDLPGTVDAKQDSIRDSNTPQSTTAPEAEASAQATTGLDLRRYELMEHLGGGGMGDVYRSGDPALGRDLAVKVMKTELQGYAAAEQRFLREARVTGSLQHPGIVPIHNLGRLADGRLHYTMRLVRGRTFADILREEAGQLERLPALLAIFEKVCQAVAYAHSKQVIHRDLKPANVMVGRFGEVQVMDWGLAKLLSAEDESSTADGAADGGGTRIHTEAPHTPLAQTRMGHEMGTPAYMPPEQALGEWDRVDERADVFALGAILCQILTGRPPYSGSDSREVLRKSKQADLAEASARLENGNVDTALRNLCRDCLAAAQEGRPRDAEQVAQRVAAYQTEVQERLRRAELERTAARVQARWERKKRRWILAAALLSLAGGAVIAWEAVRATKAENRAVTAADAERQAKELAQNRLGQIENANDVLTSIFHDLNPRAEEKGGPSLRQQLSQHLQHAAARLDEGAVGDPVAVARLQATLGSSLMYLGQTKLAIELLSKAGRTLEEQLGANHLDTLRAHNNLAEAYHSAGRSREAILLHEQTLKQLEAKLGADHPDTFTIRNNLANAYDSAGRTAEAIRLHAQTLKQREAKLGPDHSNTLASRANLSAAYLAAGRGAEAIPLYEQTLKQMEATLGPEHSDTLTCRNNLALTYLSAGRTADAIRLFEKTLKHIAAKLGPDHPASFTATNNLALAYQSAGRIAEAIRLYQQTLKQMEAKLGSDHADTLLLMAHLGKVYQGTGRLTEAISLLETALQRGRQRSGGLPASLVRLPDALARTYEQVGQFDKAESIYRDSLKQAQQFGPDDPRTAGALAQLGNNLLQQKRFLDAESQLRRCLQVREAKQPDEWNTCNTRSMLGEALLGQKKFAEAEPLLVQGYEGIKKRQGKMPPPIRQLRLSEALERLVRLYEATDQKNKAADWRKKLDEGKAAQKKTKP